MGRGQNNDNSIISFKITYKIINFQKITRNFKKGNIYISTIDHNH